MRKGTFTGSISQSPNKHQDLTSDIITLRTNPSSASHSRTGKCSWQFFSAGKDSPSEFSPAFSRVARSGRYSGTIGKRDGWKEGRERGKEEGRQEESEFFFFFFFFFFFLMATPAISGDSRGRGGIQTVAAGHSHSNAGSELCLRPTLRITAMPDP